MARQPGTVGAAVGAADGDAPGGGGGKTLRGDAVPTRGGVDATRGRRGRRGAQIVSSGAVQGEERERRGELVGKSHLWRSRLPVCYAHRFCAALACEKYDGVGLRGAGLAQLFGAAAGVFAGFVGRRLICALRFVR